MIELTVPDLMELSAFFTNLSAQEIAVIGPLMLSLASAVLLWVLLRRQSKGAPVKSAVSGIESPEVGTQGLSDVTRVQGELRELVREFSTLAEQVLQAVDGDRMGARLPKAGGAALQLVDLGLTPAEAARATQMTVGEVALLMNLRKAQTSRLCLSERTSMEVEDVAVKATDGIGGGHCGRMGVNGDAH